MRARATRRAPWAAWVAVAAAYLLAFQAVLASPAWATHGARGSPAALCAHDADASGAPAPPDGDPGDRADCCVLGWASAAGSAPPPPNTAALPLPPDPRDAAAVTVADRPERRAGSRPECSPRRSRAPPRPA